MRTVKTTTSRSTRAAQMGGGWFDCLPAATPPTFDTSVEDILFFEANATTPRVWNEQTLIDQARRLRRDRSLRITLVGYANSRGSSSRARRVAQERVENVRDALVSRGARVFQITVEVAGAAKLQGNVNTPRGRAVNRRVQLLWSRAGETHMAAGA